ncbi:MAG: metalloregulator ArsR/SmtB family transcription factor [Ardenticatenales bacterium]|nr:metalloregulator ArsR/SmtB family transcription factor [Ardenticatenales bacterium]
MSATGTAERELETRAELFKALGHPTRLLLVNLIAAAPRHTEELADIVALSPGTVSHHIGLLVKAGLLTSRRDQYYRVYSLVGEAMDRRLGELVRLSQPGFGAGATQDAWRQRVLDTFFVRGRLTHIPAQRKKRRVVLDRLVEDFEPDRDYPEAEVNRVLVDAHDDVATLRRELVAERLLVRAGGVYRRVP